MVGPVSGLRGLKRSEYDQLVSSGAFDGEPVELLDGGIYVMSAQGAPHTTMTGRLRRRLEREWLRQGEERFLVHTHSPIVAGDLSEPEPDLYVYDTEADSCAGLPSYAHLVVEVAESSQFRDLGHKSRVHAEAGFPEYWVLDLPRREVVVHRDPRPDLGQYAEVRRVPFTTELEVLGVAVRLADLTA
jgi:Uma2 family endonuclease